MTYGSDVTGVVFSILQAMAPIFFLVWFVQNSKASMRRMELELAKASLLMERSDRMRALETAEPIVIVPPAPAEPEPERSKPLPVARIHSSSAERWTSPYP